MVLRAWFAVCPSERLDEHPLPVTLFGQNIVMVRAPSGQVFAHARYCPHRGADLLQGTQREGGVVCAYHGWEFDRCGRCASVPAHGATLQMGRRLLPVYPVVERAGLVWVFSSCIGTQTPPPLHLFPEVGSHTWATIPFQVRWNAHFSRVVESVLDVSHLPFVHPETTGADVDATVIGPEMHWSEGRMLIYPTPFAPSHPMEPRPYVVDTEERVEIELLFPNQWIIRTPMGDVERMCTYLTFTPIDDAHTDIFGLALRNFDFDSAFLDVFHIEHTEFVMAQDQAVIEQIRPRRAPFDFRGEAHVPSDAPTIRFRYALRIAERDANASD